MRQRLLDVAHIAGFEVHGASAAAGAEYRHSRLTADVVLPLIRVGMPVELTHTAGVDSYDCDRDGRRNFEHARIDDAHLSSARRFRGAVFTGSKRELARRRAERSGGRRLVQGKWSGHRRVENEE